MKTLLLVIALTFSSQAALAKDSSSGCGPAWYILKKNSLLSSFGRYITNTVLIPIVTLGMTFGTSNCSKHSLVSADYESLRYAEKNLPLLKQGIARGHGMVLTNYLGTFGCQFHETERLTSILQQNYGEIFGPSHSSFEIVSATQNVINSYPNLDGICKTS